MSDFYENLLRATNNLDDITTEKYGTITSKKGNYCTVKETDNDLEHTNVPIVNGAELNVGDKVIIGFLNNSIYDVICYGAIGKTIHDTTKQDTLQSGVNIKTINHQSLLGSGNINIQGGGGGSIVMVGSFEIDNNGHLIATIPDGASNPYHIDFSTGHLIYDTAAGDT
jgi:hypothetical protein